MLRERLKRNSNTLSLNSRICLTILFLINASAALLLGHLAKAGWVVLLPILPAVINYLLLYTFSGSPIFRGR